MVCTNSSENGNTDIWLAVTIPNGSRTCCCSFLTVISLLMCPGMARFSQQRQFWIRQPTNVKVSMVINLPVITYQGCMIECISILSGQLLVFVHFHFKYMKISLRWLDICWGCVIHQQSMNMKSDCVCFYFCRTCCVVVWHCTGKCRLIWKVCTVLRCNDNINLTKTKADYDGLPNSSRFGVSESRWK